MRSFCAHWLESFSKSLNGFTSRYMRGNTDLSAHQKREAGPCGSDEHVGSLLERDQEAVFGSRVREVLLPTVIEPPKAPAIVPA